MQDMLKIVTVVIATKIVQSAVTVEYAMHTKNCKIYKVTEVNNSSSSVLLYSHWKKNGTKNIF